MKMYYTNYPRGQFQAKSDSKALEISKAKVIYKDNDTSDGTPFIILRKPEVIKSE